MASVEVIVKDLDALRAAADRMGFEFREGQTTHKWFGRFLNDWRSDRAAVNKGRDPATFGTCQHALRLKASPGGYEVGVCQRPGGDGYDLVYDAIGGELERAAGVDLVRLRDEVTAETATRVLSRRGYRIERQDEAGQIVLLAT